MRYSLYLLLCCALLLTNCADGNQPVGGSPKTPEQLAVGVWEWVRTDGGWSPVVITPEAGEERGVLVLYANGTYYHSYPRDTTSTSGRYRLVRAPLFSGDSDTTLYIEFDVGPRTPIRITADSLQTDARAWDGQRITYRRKGTAEICANILQPLLVTIAPIDPYPDPFHWPEMSVAGDTLCAVVQYSGGCREHQFGLLIDPVLTSARPYVNIILSHNANEDPCREILTEKIGFDLTPLKKHLQSTTGQQSGLVVLRIFGGDREQKLYYRYR